MAGRPAVLKVDIVSDYKSKGSDQAESKLGRLGRVAAGVGAAVGAGLVVAGAAAVGFGIQAVKSASSVEQSFGALESVYGDNAAQAKRWAESAAQDVGLAKSEYADLSAVVGSQLQGMGMAQADAAAQSDQLIKMGADLAATFGGSVSDAVGAVGSLLRGERDPIERYGVSIKAADVQARLAAQGLDKLTGTARTQAEAQATLALLTEKTKNAHGAFGRESNTLAGQQARLRAQFENVKATLGARLIPVVTQVFGWLNRLVSGSGGTSSSFARFGAIAMTVVTPALAGARSAFASVKQAIDNNRPAIDRLIGAARTLAPVVGTVLGAAFRSFGFIVGGTIGLIGRLVNIVSAAIGKVRALASAVSNSAVGKVVGALFGGPPLATGAPGVVGGGAPLTGYGTGLATAALATAALAPLAGLAGSSSGTASRTVIEHRTVVELRTGAIIGLDGPDVARQLANLLDSRQVATGRRATYTGRSG